MNIAMSITPKTTNPLIFPAASSLTAFFSFVTIGNSFAFKCRPFFCWLIFFITGRVETGDTESLGVLSAVVVADFATIVSITSVSCFCKLSCPKPGHSKANRKIRNSSLIAFNQRQRHGEVAGIPCSFSPVALLF